jgi:thiol-disulfide isomerase/thioredoxin
MDYIYYILIIILLGFYYLYNSLTHIYYFYSDGCPHCVIMKPHYTKVKQEMGMTYLFHEIDMNSSNTKDQALIKKHNVKGMPTLIKVNSNGTLTYTDERTHQKIKTWLEK